MQMPAPGLHLLTLAKEPATGRVKTRLCPSFSPEQAARLAAAALTDTLAAVAATPARHRTLVLAGATGSWLPAGVEVIRQRGVGLDERMAAAFEDAFARSGLPMLLIGMDTPQVTPDLLEAAGRPLLTGAADAVLGLAQDGGFWGIGLRRPDAELLLGIPMSTAGTGAAQLARLTGSGLRVRLLPTLRDVDTAEDAPAVAAQCPGSRFAAALRSLPDRRAELTAIPVPA